MDAKARRSELEAARRSNDVPYWRLESQGQRLTLRHITYHGGLPHVNTRGPITCFSRRARARALRRIAEVDWARAGEGALVTLTYPDECSDHTMIERKTHRYLINRYICHCATRHLGCMWRVEWMPRLSGRYIGQLRPHMHLLYLGHHNIGEENVRVVWQRIIGAERHTQVDVTGLSVGNMVACYVAKYCAKEANASYLDNVPKRNKTGRHAGELRSDLIPRHPMQVVERLDHAMVLRLRERASETLWWYDPRYDEGFTILGDLSQEFVQDYVQNCVDSNPGWQ